MMMQIHPIRDEDSYSAALIDVERYFDTEPAPGTPEGERFAVLLDLIAAYESRRWPIPVGDPIDFLSNVMKLTGRTQADLAALLGSRSRASEIMSRKRHLTLAQVRTLSREWRIPADALIGGRCSGIADAHIWRSSHAKVGCESNALFSTPLASQV